MPRFPARPLFRFTGLLRIVLKRQWYYPGLSLLALLGLVMAVGLISSASFFSQAVDQVILDSELAEISSLTARPPFSSRVYTYPSARRPLSLDQVDLLADDIAQTLSSEVGLPLNHVGFQAYSSGMMLQPGADSQLYGEEERVFLGTVSLAYIEQVAPQMDIIEGIPMDGGASDGPLDVWMHTRLAQTMGANIGETFSVGLSLAHTQIPLRLSGIWQAKDPSDPFWFSDPDGALLNTLLIRRRDYTDVVEPLVSSKTSVAHWHVILDESEIVPARGRSYIAGFERAMAIINQFLPETKLNAPSIESLQDFVKREKTLTLLLLGFNIPALGILLYFLMLISAIIARRQRHDAAVFMSRGMGLSGLIGMTLLEQLILFAVGLPLGIGLGMLLARLMGYTASFLSFTSRAPLPVSLEGINPYLILLALGVVLLARLWPTVQAARESVISEGQEQARPARAPFWFRYYLDVLLIFPTFYAYRQLVNRGSLAGFGSDQSEVFFRDPLLILVPALFILTIALLLVRLFTVVMRLIDRLAGVTPWLTLHLALRQLGRQSQTFLNPLLLVIVSLALGIYLLSIAASLDQWLADRIYYQIGADLAFEPFNEFLGQDLPHGEWIPLRETFSDLPGVQEATRVGDYPAEILLSSKTKIRARFLAIDRVSFPAVAWFRHDFSSEPLGSLMNRLAASPESVLVSQQFLGQHNLHIGDQLPVEVAINSIDVNTHFKIAGTFTYFPTVYEEDRANIVGNLDVFTSLLGAVAPHELWLQTHEELAGDMILSAVPKTGVKAIKTRDSRALIDAEKAKMERVGIFGTLTVGFLAAILMAGLGLLITSYASMHDRIYRFAILHAVGLRRQQIVGQVILEYSGLLAFGVAAAALTGMLTSELFVPFFRITGETNAPLPPLLPLINRESIWYLTVTFATVIILIEVILITMSLYQRLVVMLKGHWG